MRAWALTRPAPIGEGPLRLIERPAPGPADGEIRVRVSACGVCRTDLHVVEGDLPVRKDRVVPGHQVVGTVESLGPGAGRFAVGDRVGIAWLRHTCGVCRFCRRGAENLCVEPRFTGWDADGGYAEYAVVPQAYAYRIPDAFEDVQAAPLLCAGVIGWRAYKRAEVPPGGRLGLYGFGASAHLTAQVALARGDEVHVVTRSEAGQDLARELGAVWAGGAGAAPPVPLDAAIVFAPVGEVVRDALRALDRGGVCSVAGIWVSDLPPLDYERDLFQERELRSVTANTRSDGEEFLRVAERVGVAARVTTYPLDQADRALADLAAGRYEGVAVLDVGG